MDVEEVVEELAYMNIFLWGDRINFPSRVGYGSFEDGRMVERWWELRKGEPQRLALVKEVYVDIEDNLVVKWEKRMIVKEVRGLDKKDEEVEIKMMAVMKLRRLK